MVDFDLIFEQHNINNNINKDDDFVSRKELEQKNKFRDITLKIKSHSKKLNYSGGEKKAKMLIQSTKSNNKKNFVMRFLK